MGWDVVGLSLVGQDKTILAKLLVFVKYNQVKQTG